MSGRPATSSATVAASRVEPTAMPICAWARVTRMKCSTRRPGGGFLARGVDGLTAVLNANIAVTESIDTVMNVVHDATW